MKESSKCKVMRLFCLVFCYHAFLHFWLAASKLAKLGDGGFLVKSDISTEARRKRASKFFVAKYCKIKQNVGCISNAYTTTTTNIASKASKVSSNFIIATSILVEEEGEQRQKNALKSF